MCFELLCKDNEQRMVNVCSKDVLKLCRCCSQLEELSKNEREKGKNKDG